MIKINKSSPGPASLVEEKQKLVSKNDGILPENSYSDLLTSNTKADIQRMLLKEQGHICAYCTGRISLDLDTETGQRKMKIEHFYCQDTYPNKQLDYDNMLGVCCGNTDSELHCDSSKKNQNLLYNPSKKQDFSKLKISYNYSDGEIKSEDNDFNQEINSILNLNHIKLKSNRLNALQGIHQALSRSGNARTTKPVLNNLLSNWNNIDKEGKKKPYCGIVIHYLEKRLRAEQAIAK